MTRIILLVLCFGLGNILHAQFDEKRIKNPKPTMGRDFQNIINTQLIPYSTLKSANPTKASYKGKLGLDFSLSEQDYVKLIKKNDASGFYWLYSYAPGLTERQLGDNKKEWLEISFRKLGFKLEGLGIETLDEWTDEQGVYHARMRQTHMDVPLYDAEILMHTKTDRHRRFNGKMIDPALLQTSKPEAISLDKLKNIVISHLNNYKEESLNIKSLQLDFSTRQWREELVWYKDSEDNYVLSYHVQAYANPAERYEYFVNAETGELLDYFSSICKFHGEFDKCSHKPSRISNSRPELSTSTSSVISSTVVLDGPTMSNATDLSGSERLINTYEVDDEYFLIDASREMFQIGQSVLPDDPVGAIWTIDLNNTSPVNENSLYTHVISLDNLWNDSPEGVSAHFNAGLAYEYFKENFNRESISGTGQSIISFINVTDEFGNSMGNAFWNGIGIYYGNGDDAFESLGRALDVAGHEISHGVIESTANLEYRDESGAMNEAFADIFGAMIDRENWLIGEDVVKLEAYPSGALRDMSDPYNGAQTGDFGAGWQPRHYDERYTGQEDNGGVHINSGIINHAYYLFAEDVGKVVAEQVYYRALTTYLTRSSGFQELRFAVLQSAEDLFGSAVAVSAGNAFDQVGILDESEIEFEEDFDTNPGSDLLLVSDQDLSQLYLFNLQTGEEIYNPLSTTGILSKPSITDDGSRIVFVGTDNHVHLIDLDWSTDPPAFTENVITVSPDWRNAVISKNGRFLALLENVVSNNIIVFDVLNDNVNVFELTNPTYTQGINTGEVQFADVMEFDATSTSIMYDAFNQVQGSAGALEYWDVGFIEVWNPQADTWALGDIEKLFNNLPEGINIGNPTFSKNSPYIIAFDIFDGAVYEIIGVNLETQDLNTILPNTGLGYPSYSRDDGFMIYDLDIFGYTDLGVLQLTSDKIERVANSDEILLVGGKWGVWFSNGERTLSSTNNLLSPDQFGLTLSPNPASDFINLEILDKSLYSASKSYFLYDIHGRLLKSIVDKGSSMQIDVRELQIGSYNLVVEAGGKTTSLLFIKN